MMLFFFPFIPHPIDIINVIFRVISRHFGFQILDVGINKVVIVQHVSHVSA